MTYVHSPFVGNASSLPNLQARDAIPGLWSNRCSRLNMTSNIQAQTGPKPTRSACNTGEKQCAHILINVCSRSKSTVLLSVRIAEIASNILQCAHHKVDSEE
eukprot:3409431-Amphidinium_carterae.1